MKITVITSCSAKGYAQYGRQCIESLHNHWPLDISLYVVSEDALDLPACEGRDVQFLDLFENEKAHKFHRTYKDSKKVNGLIGSKRHNRHWRTGYSFRHDAYKFSKKVFAIELVASRIPHSGRLIWLDADTVTFKDIPMELFERVAPASKAIACLTRKHYHSECGFVAYNLDVPETAEFITEFAELYISNSVFRLPEWHDSFVFDWLRKKYKTPTWAIPHNNSSQPFNDSELGQYMDHLKGNRKVVPLPAEDATAP